MSDYKKKVTWACFLSQHMLLYLKHQLCYRWWLEQYVAKYAVQRDLTFHYRNKMNKSRN